MTLIHLALMLDGTVVAHFMHSSDAVEFCSAKGLTHMPFNTESRDRLPVPQVGSIYRA